MLYINDRVYTFTFHLEEQIEKRGILINWIEAVMLNPHSFQLSNASGYFLYDGYLSNRQELLRVVVDEETEMIVTAYFLE